MRDFKVGERVFNTETQVAGEVVYLKHYGYGHGRPVVQYDNGDTVTANPDKLRYETPPSP